MMTRGGIGAWGLAFKCEVTSSTIKSLWPTQLQLRALLVCLHQGSVAEPKTK